MFDGYIRSSNGLFFYQIKISIEIIYLTYYLLFKLFIGYSEACEYISLNMGVVIFICLTLNFTVNLLDRFACISLENDLDFFRRLRAPKKCV